MGFLKSVGSFFGNLGKSTVSSLVGAGIDTASNAISAAQQYKYQKRLQDAQQQYNTEMWDKQNAYNTPSAQIQRLQEAGVNPMLAAGSTSLSAVGATSSTPSSPGFSMPNSSVGNSVGDNFIQQQKMDAELDIMSKQAKGLEIKNLVDAAVAQARIDGIKSLSKEMKNKADLVFEQMLWQQGQNDLFSANYQDSISQKRIQTDSMALEKAILQIKRNYIDRQEAADLADTWSRVQLNYATGKATLQQAKAALINAWANDRSSKALSDLYGSQTEYNQMRNGSIKVHGAFYETEFGKAYLKNWLSSQESDRELRNALAVGGEKGFFEFIGSIGDNWLGTNSYSKSERTEYQYNKKGKMTSKTVKSSGKGASSRRRAPRARPGRRG